MNIEKRMIYKCVGSYDFKVEGELPSQGTLSGEFGEMKFSICPDGIVVYDSTMLGSGLYPGPISAQLNVPASINGIPVIEAHKTVYPTSTYPIAIEGRNLKRVHLNIEKGGLEKQMQGLSFEQMFVTLWALGENNAIQSDKRIFLEVDTCTPLLEEIHIKCNEKCKMKPSKIKSKKIYIDSYNVVVEREFSSCVEKIAFSGNVYPEVYDDWDGPIVCTDVFKGCSRLESVEGTLKGNYPWEFSDCSSLRKLHLANGPRKLAYSAFRNCISIEDIYVPDTIEELGNCAFEGCISLKKIHLPQKITGISKSCFKNCTSIEKVFLSNSIVAIGDSAFENCERLKTPWMPAQLEEIGERAFYGCQSITMITIPEKVKKIGEQAFGNCPNLTIKGTVGTVAESYAKENGIQFVEQSN